MSECRKKIPLSVCACPPAISINDIAAIRSIDSKGLQNRPRVQYSPPATPRSATQSIHPMISSVNRAVVRPSFCSHAKRPTKRSCPTSQACNAARFRVSTKTFFFLPLTFPPFLSHPPLLFCSPLTLDLLHQVSRALHGLHWPSSLARLPSLLLLPPLEHWVELDS